MQAMPRNPEEHDLFARIPTYLWDKLSEEAEREDRSATAQLIRILRERYGGRPKLKSKKPKTRG